MDVGKDILSGVAVRYTCADNPSSMYATLMKVVWPKERKKQAKRQNHKLRGIGTRVGQHIHIVYFQWYFTPGILKMGYYLSHTSYGFPDNLT